MHGKPPSPEKELASQTPVDACPPGNEEPPFDHFFEPEDLSQQENFLYRAMGLGTQRKMALLRTIFSRCRWEGRCLVWQGPHSGTGRGGSYGRFSFEGKTAAVHRVVYAAVFGPIPGHKQVDHECNNRLCCNPLHLRHMTHKKNQKLRDKRKADGCNL